MKIVRKTPAHKPMADFSKTIGRTILHVRAYREAHGFLCERELIENDGTAFIQALPFVHVDQLREFLMADPLYKEMRKEAIKMLSFITKGGA